MHIKLACWIIGPDLLVPRPGITKRNFKSTLCLIWIKMLMYMILLPNTLLKINEPGNLEKAIKSSQML